MVVEGMPPSSAKSCGWIFLPRLLAMSARANKSATNPAVAIVLDKENCVHEISSATAANAGAAARIAGDRRARSASGSRYLNTLTPPARRDRDCSAGRSNQGALEHHRHESRYCVLPSRGPSPLDGASRAAPPFADVQDHRPTH